MLKLAVLSFWSKYVHIYHLFKLSLFLMFLSLIKTEHWLSSTSSEEISAATSNLMPISYRFIKTVIKYFSFSRLTNKNFVRPKLKLNETYIVTL